MGLPGSDPMSRYVTCEGRQIHYMEWGKSDAPVIVMWHGLARNGRDFDELASAFSSTHRIICPDTIGRGLSEWSDAPQRDYHFANYSKIAIALFDALGIGRADWVGTSMGGALGIAVAGSELRERIRKLVLNDIGPTLPKGPFERIKQYVGNPPSFATMTELEAYFRIIYQPFGGHSDAQWLRMAENLSRRMPDGKVTTHYDPNIVRQMFHYPDDFELWDAYEKIAIPTLVLRGVSSDVLLPETASWMTQHGPHARVAEIPECGHAPALNTKAQIQLIIDFVRG